MNHPRSAFAIMVLCASLAVGPAARAEGDTNAGVAAIRANDYDTALTILRPRAEGGDAEARYWMGAVGSGEPFAARPEPFIAFAMLPPQCYEEGRGICSAEWVGTLEIPTDGQYQFFTETRGRSTIEVSIDGQPLRPGLIRLSAGSHSVRATASMPREFESGVSLRWGTGGEKDLVPFYRVED